MYIKINSASSASSASSSCEAPKSLIFFQIHLQSCILAGGVAVGVSMSAVRHPWEAMIIGFAAAIISSVGFQYLKVFFTPSYTWTFASRLHSLYDKTQLLTYFADPHAAGIPVPWHMCYLKQSCTSWSTGMARASCPADQRLRWSHSSDPVCCISHL